jgi:hypothetical protein
VTVIQRSSGTPRRLPDAKLAERTRRLLWQERPMEHKHHGEPPREHDYNGDSKLCPARNGEAGMFLEPRRR